MDFHQFDTVEDVKGAHIADEAIQQKYGVRYLQFWVNENAGTVFCLTEGPDKESCELVHKLAHGNTACALVEVEPGFYKMMMGHEHRLDHGLVKNNDGSVDLGYRTIVYVRTDEPLNQVNGNADLRQIVLDKIDFFHGRLAKQDNDEGIIGVFDEATDGVQCAMVLQKLSSEMDIAFRIGISTGQPVTLDGDFFSAAIQRANYLSMAARNNQIMMSELTPQLCHPGLIDSQTAATQRVDEGDFKLLSDFISTTERHLADEAFTIDELCHEVGLSRPQLYRKITALSGRAPNDFLRDIRIERGWNLLRRKKGNISQVAIEVGYSNPSYFTKCFTERYGITPSKFIRQASH